jgi:hypothetical protein
MDGNGRGRGVAPVVGKALEAGIVVLFVSLAATGLYGGVVPEYRSAAAAELGDRTLAAAADGVEANALARASGRVRVDVALPERIAGRTYRIVGDGRTLVLDHADSGVGGRVGVALPPGVTIRGAWASDGPTVLALNRTPNGTVLRLAPRKP